MKKVILFSLLMLSSHAFAGNQQYELLQAETQQMMANAISDQAPQISSFSSKEEEQRWISKMDIRLSKYIKDSNERENLLRSIHYESVRAGIQPELVLGLLQVESGFKKYALSSVGARGYMQVMPFWTDSIGTKEHNLFHLRTNLRYGCTILRHYLDMEKGNMFRALGRYNGSTGKAPYPNAVTAAMHQFMDN